MLKLKEMTAFFSKCKKCMEFKKEFILIHMILRPHYNSLFPFSQTLSLPHMHTHKQLLQMGLLHNLVHFPDVPPAEIQFHKTCSIDCILCRYICPGTFCRH